MTMRVLLASLAAGAVTLPAPAGAPAAAAVEDLTIRSVTLRPATPVVGPADSVRMVIEVVARGVTGPEGVRIKVEPGAPPASAGTSFPVTAPRRGAPARPGPGRPGPGRGPALAPGPAPGPVVAARLAPGAAGTVAGKIVSRPGEGWVTWRFAPEKSLSRWYPAGPWTVSVTARGTDGAEVTGHTGFLLKRLTRFGGVEAIRGNSGVRVTGVLNRVDPQGDLDYAPFPGQPVEILHRPGEKAGWSRVAGATTDSRGRFARTVGDRTGGEWRIRFQGTNHYAPRLGIVHKVSR